MPNCSLLDGTQPIAIDPENMLGFLITETSYMMRQCLINRLQAQHKDFGITIDELPIFGRVLNNPGIGQTALNAVALKDKATVTRMLTAMEKKGLIVRSADPRDRRARHVSLGKQGQELLAYLRPELLKLRAEVAQGIPEADLEITLRTMQILYHRFSGLTR